MPQLLILLLTGLVQAGASFPADMRALPGQAKHASWDNMNVMAHGLLQLGQGLKEHVDKTKVQMREVNAKLKSFNGTLAELEEKRLDQDEALKARNKEVEDRENLVLEVAKEVMVKLEEVKKQNDNINSRMERLEEKMAGMEPVDSNDSDHTRVPLIQRLMLGQSRCIDQLVDKIKQQQDKLEKQSLHLQALQNKVAHKRVKSQRRRDEETALRGEAADDGNQKSGLARDCHELFVQGQRTSGIYTIQTEGSRPFNVLCDMTSDRGWTVIQKRHDGSQNFNLEWESYKKGFGSLNGEFWLGLENIHTLSKQDQYILQVELTDWTGQEQPPARYRFQLDGEETRFTLHLEDESSSGDKSIMSTGASGLPFSTRDADNDLTAEVNCADLRSGGWWFSSCGDSNLNGKYFRRLNVARRQRSRRQGMFWTSSKGQKISVKTTLLKIAPATKTQ